MQTVENLESRGEVGPKRTRRREVERWLSIGRKLLLTIGVFQEKMEKEEREEGMSERGSMRAKLVTYLIIRKSVS